MRAYVPRCAPLLAALAICWSPAVYCESGYFGEHDAVVVTSAGCNASSPVQLPHDPTLFIDRQLLTADGEIATANDCSGGNPDNPKHGKVFNRWSIVLDKLDWQTHTFSVGHPLVDTSLDQSGHSKARITGGPMKGAIIRSAYDASVVAYRGQVFVVYECILEPDSHIAVDGTSVCISVYEPARQAIDMSRTKVIVSGAHANGRFYAAAVPELLAAQGRLFLYWSALEQQGPKFLGISVRGAELEVSGAMPSVKGSGGQLVHSVDDGVTTVVWRPEPSDPMSNSAVDIRALWVAGQSIIAMASEGGGGCVAPSDTSKGCYHLVVVRPDRPLADFNHAQRVDEGQWPSNAQEYTRPIRDPDGHFWFIGHYARPKVNGFSETRPVPNADQWQKTKEQAVLVMYPLGDKTLWPTE